MKGIHSRLDGWLGSPRTRQSRGGVKMLYRFDAEFEPMGQRRLKIEIATREHFSVFEFDRPRFGVSSPWFEGEANITTYQVEELLGTKLRALYQRKKGRDLFDLSLALSQLDLSPDRIVECFLRYMEHGKTPVSRAEFEANLSAKARDRAFATDVRPLLAPGTPWDFDAALQTVSRQVIARIPGARGRGTSPPAIEQRSCAPSSRESRRFHSRRRCSFSITRGSKANVRLLDPCQHVSRQRLEVSGMNPRTRRTRRLPARNGPAITPESREPRRAPNQVSYGR